MLQNFSLYVQVSSIYPSEHYCGQKTSNVQTMQEIGLLHGPIRLRTFYSRLFSMKERMHNVVYTVGP